MRLFFYTFLVLCVVGCGDGTDLTTKPSAGSAADLATVRQTAAELLAVPESSLSDDVPLSKLPTPMDDLDLVELVMELEELHNVSIPDNLIVTAAGTNVNLIDHLTIRKIATVLQQARTNEPEATYLHSATQADKKAVVTLTPTATAKVREAQEQNGKPFLRVSVKQGGSTGFMYDMQFDDRHDPTNYFRWTADDVTIVVDRESAIYIDGAIIDWQSDTDGRSGFSFDNPNAIEKE